MILATEVVTVRRRSGSYVDGIFTEGAQTSFRSELAIHPAPSRALQQLPEAARSRDVRMAYADDAQPALRTGGGLAGELADLVERSSGEIFEVQSVVDWTIHSAGIPHREYTLVRVADDEG